MPKQSAAPTPVVEVSDSDEERPTRKRRKRTVRSQKSELAASNRHEGLWRYLLSANLYPSGLPGSDNDEYGNMILDAWDAAHDDVGITEDGYVGDPAAREVKLIRTRVSTVCGAFKAAAETLLAENYGLVNPQTLTDAMPDKIAETIAANRAMVEKIEKTFYYLHVP
ncbi:hypothetical protein K438DRAFT_177870 [Mycena galopus ATCC 62051]|nr:hypothetical protein K438DRAFT_177870 [Mycena galopus ATCC 62051]